jgi:hypothetical protein
MTLIGLCRNQYRQRTGRELTDDNVWIRETPPRGSDKSSQRIGLQAPPTCDMVS